ncbi:hypothetical protein F4779DRAFT_627066 [Xylariaceae sp. FL0662B]|nr:hypothetical protein F4779DRAFT_627066 [Xylariaceae sp. FL0662B]
MSSRMLFKSPAAARPAAAASFMTGRQAIVQRTFTSTPLSQSYKETSTNTDPGHNPEKHKQDLLLKQKEGKAHWKPELASDSEEAVKADRASGRGAEDVAMLQERTKNAAEETTKAGTSLRDGL